jgi:transposase
MNTKLHAICDGQGRPLNLFVTAGQVSDYIGARALLGSMPKVEWLLGDRGYDADWFREALKEASPSELVHRYVEETEDREWRTSDTSPRK